MGHNSDITNSLNSAVKRDVLKAMDEDVIKKLTDPITPPDVKRCPCCGQDRAFPTQPGKWEYKQYYHDWIKCEIKVSDGTEFSDAEKGGLLFYPEYHPSDLQWELDHLEDEEEKASLKKQWDGPQLWPDMAMWRKKN